MTDIANLVHQTSSSTGTGNLTLAAVNGKSSFNDAFGTGGTDLFYYFISNRGASEWEVGTGHLSDSTTLVRDTVIESTNANAAVNFSAGTKDVTNAIPAAAIDADRAKLAGVEANADVTDGTNVAAALNATSKNPPIDADRVYGGDSTSSFGLVYATWTQTKAFLKTYFDTLYQPLVAALTSWGSVTRASGFDTFVATPSSSNLKSLVTDETGSGALVFATSPALVTPTGIVKGDVGLGNVDNVSVLGQQTIWVPAGAMTPRTTNGAAAGSFETSTNDVMLPYLAFDATTAEGAQFGIQMPKGWNEGPIIPQFVWTHPSTTTNFGVSWELAAVAFANDDAADTAFGTLQEIDDTGGTTHDIYITDETPAITVAGSPGAGNTSCSK